MNKKLSELTRAEVGILALGYLFIFAAVVLLLSIESIFNSILQ